MKIIIPSVESIIRTNKFCSKMNHQESVVLNKGKVSKKKARGARLWLLKLTYFLWCPVRDSNPHARALGSKPNVSTNSTNWATRYVKFKIMQN
jgi:hypothetical protein